MADATPDMCRIADMKDVILLGLANQIRSMRIRGGLSQSDLAATAGANRKAIIEQANDGRGSVAAGLDGRGTELHVDSDSCA